MSRIFIYLLLSSLILQHTSSLGQNTDSESLKTLSSEVRTEGISFSREGLNYQALEKFQLYQDFRKKIYGKESYYLGSGYLSIGITYKNLGQFNLALEAFELAEKNYLLKNNPNIVGLARLYINIGNVYRAKLDYRNALSYYNRALIIYHNQEKLDPYDISNASYSIAELNYIIGNYDTTITIIDQYISTADIYTKIYFNELLALSHQQIGNMNKALNYYRKTLTLAIDTYDNSNMELAIVYMNFTEFLLSIGEYDQGLENLNYAFGIVKKSQSSRGEQLSRYYELMGGYFAEKTIESQEINKFKQLKKRNLKESVKWYTKSINALSSTKNNIDIPAIKIRDCLSFLDCLALIQQIGDTYYQLALIDKEEKAELVENSLISALEYFDAASKLTQQARREISSDESKIQLSELEHYTFAKTIETAYLAYEVTQNKEFLELAFNNSEQLKSSSVFDKLSDNLAQENSLIPDSLLQIEKKLNSTISIFNQKIFEMNSYAAADSSLIKEYNKKIFNASRERDKLNRLFEEEYSDYYNLKYSNNMLSIEEVQKEIKKDDALIEYVIIEPTQNKSQRQVDTTKLLFTFLITKNSYSFQRNSITKDLEKSINQVFSFMSNPEYIFTNNTDSKEFCVASYKLYNLLIAPFEADLQNKNLVIIPDETLNYISFDGLLRTLPDTSKTIDFSKLDYLIKDYNINYANSVNILFQNQKSQQKLNNRTLAFAPEYRSEQFEMSNASYTLMPLPGVQKEVNAIANTIKTTVFSAENATEQNFRKHSKDYDILHLAMHAYLNDSLPAFSRLAFAPQTGTNPIETDGWLNTTDIYHLDLKAKLTVLSACNTGVGKLRKGEGMMSLARGFLYAGCPSIIMSLWEVEDESGTQIMSLFYKNLKKGKTKDEALRLAKLSYLEDSNSRLAHPHYWMSFKSIGNKSPIYNSYDVYFFALLILLIMAFTIDQSLRIRKMRKTRKKS